MMRLADFVNLISQMPVSKQAFASKRSTWLPHLQRKDVAGAALQSILDAFYKDSENVFVSRCDLRNLADKADLAEFIMATIIWGYPRGMRGNHFSNLLDHTNALCQLLSEARSHPISDWKSHYEKVTPIQGIGLSTYTKLLHFLSVRVEGHEALILDQRFVEVAQQSLFEELASIRGLTSVNAPRRYPEYLECMDRVASRLSLPPDKIEFFLFEFGLHLKSGLEPSGVEVRDIVTVNSKENAKAMDEKTARKKEDDNPYAQEEYEKDLAHSDVVLYYQRKLSEQLGHQVTLSEAEDVAYGLDGTTESRTEELRQTHASEQSRSKRKDDHI